VLEQIVNRGTADAGKGIIQKGSHTISIRKFLEQDTDQLLASTQAAYRSALLAMGKSAVTGYAIVSHRLQEALSEVEGRVREKPTRAVVKASEVEVSKLLDQWGRQTAEHLKQTAEEIKSLLVALARTADAVGERDQACTEKLRQLTGSLETIAKLDDMSRMRQSILESATELKECVREIVENSIETADRFRSQIKSYEDKLDESEQRIRRDSLTGLYNRHGMERILARRIEDRRSFSLVMVDLDNFKSVNDQYGHLAGDQLLKQFAEELRSASRAKDILGRWGGDEFVLILECDKDEARVLIQRMQRWVFGDYTITDGTKTEAVSVQASFGIATWRLGETMVDVLARADAAMYQDKNRNRLQCT
jgi:diguanylate cyclase (GGDEF)-like protein